MSAFPRDPEHFFRWVRTAPRPAGPAPGLRPPRVYGDYVEGLLRTATEYPGNARLVRRQASVVGVDRRGDRLVVRLDDGRPGATIVARAVVLATGATAGTDWAPRGARRVRPARRRPVDRRAPRRRPAAGRHRPDHGRRRDLRRPARTAPCTRSRGTTPCRARTCCRPPRPCRRRPASPGSHDLDELRAAVRAHVERTVAETGDWRAGHRRAASGHRPAVARAERGRPKRRFLAEDARAWDVRRHRMPPVTARRLADDRRRPAAGCGTPAPSSSATADRSAASTSPSPTAPSSTVGRRRQLHRPGGRAGQGPAARRAGPHRPGPPRPLRARHRHRRRRSRARRAARRRCRFYAIGSLRRGNLWETTAMPEIREQAYDVARSVVRALHGETRRRPVDPYGLTLTTSRKAAAGLQPGARPPAPPAGRRRGGPRGGGRADPGFAQAHAALALLGHEWGADGLVAQRPPGRPRRRRRAPPRRPRGQLPRRRHHPAAHRRGDRRRRPAAPHPAVPARRAGRQRRRADRRVRRPHLRHARPPSWSRVWAAPTATTGGTPASWPSSARTRSAGARRRTWRRTPSRSSRPRATPCTPAPTSTTRPASTPTGLAWLDELDPDPRSRGQPPLALLLARRPARADAVRRRRGAPSLRARAGAAAGHRLPRPGRQRRAAVALPRHRHLGGRAAQRRPSARSAPDGWLLIAAHAVRRHALRAGSGRRGRRGRSRRAAHHRAGPRRPGVPRRGRAAVRGAAGRSSRASSPWRPTGSTAVLPRTGVLGGSAAQREVLEDTLVYALARSGQGEPRRRRCSTSGSAAGPPPSTPDAGQP